MRWSIVKKAYYKFKAQSYPNLLDTKNMAVYNNEDKPFG